jgi:formate hydrogenlyase subunit 3/multisubunit Na+/H+ antiporter MnhD subunit
MFFAARVLDAVGVHDRLRHRLHAWRPGPHARFFGFFALCVSTTVGIAFAENLLTFFLFYETLTICTYPLVVHAETPQALRAGRIYLAYTADRRRLRADRLGHDARRGRAR